MAPFEKRTHFIRRERESLKLNRLKSKQQTHNSESELKDNNNISSSDIELTVRKKLITTTVTTIMTQLEKQQEQLNKQNDLIPHVNFDDIPNSVNFDDLEVDQIDIDDDKKDETKIEVNINEKEEEEITNKENDDIQDKEEEEEEEEAEEEDEEEEEEEEEEEGEDGNPLSISTLKKEQLEYEFQIKTNKDSEKLLKKSKKTSLEVQNEKRTRFKSLSNNSGINSAITTTNDDESLSSKFKSLFHCCVGNVQKNGDLKFEIVFVIFNNLSSFF
jgi:hypothetical protein